MLTASGRKTKFIGKLQVTQPNTEKLSRKGYLNEQNANLAGSIAKAKFAWCGGSGKLVQVWYSQLHLWTKWWTIYDDIPSSLIFYAISFNCISNQRTTSPYCSHEDKWIQCNSLQTSFVIWHTPESHSFCLEYKYPLLLSGSSQIALPLSHSTFQFTVKPISIFSWTWSVVKSRLSKHKLILLTCRTFSKSLFLNQLHC